MLCPIIGIPCDIKMISHLPFHAVGDKYIAAVIEAMEALPVLIPALGERTQWQAILELVDGVLLPGSPSNIEPHHYGDVRYLGMEHDPARDATTLPLIRLLLQQGIPLLGICRGFQEMNVALGGSLFQTVHEEEGLNDHREPDIGTLDELYAPAHSVFFPEGSIFRRWLGQDQAWVNSLHGQGAKRLAKGLIVEAVAADGLVEAFSVPDAKGFAFAVQWHPEWKYLENPVSMAIFNSFISAVRQRKECRSHV